MNVKDLKVGDVVMCHGMRLLVDAAPVQTSHEGGDTYYTNALVTNVDELSDPWLVSVTRCTTGWPTHEPTGEHRWALQGNSLAHFYLETEADRASRPSRRSRARLRALRARRGRRERPGRRR